MKTRQVYAVLPLVALAACSGAAGPAAGSAAGVQHPGGLVAPASVAASVAANEGDDDASTADSTEQPSPSQLRPRLRAMNQPLAPVTSGPVPDADAVAEQLADELGSNWLGHERRRAVTVRDALTGEHLLDREADRKVTPASTTKLVSAAAIVTALDPAQTFDTTVIAGESEDDVILVAGGDMLLGPGPGDEDAVSGRAGLGDLAAQTAAALAEQDADGPIQVSLDLSYLPGPQVLQTWTQDWVRFGFTGRIVQLGLDSARAWPGSPSPVDPEQEAAQAFRDALASELKDSGLTVTGAGKPDTDVAEATADDEAIELGRISSAPVRDVLALALADSDNAMVEQLARQAAAAAGQDTDQESVMAWILRAVAGEYRIDTTGATVIDASGLSDDTEIPVRVIGDVLVAAADGSHPPLQQVLAAGGLPIAGYTGTLASRFHLPVHAEAIGNARAKTGSLPGVSSLAGTVVTADGRLLVYALTADRIGEDGAILEARSVQDEIVAELARCGC